MRLFSLNPLIIPLLIGVLIPLPASTAAVSVQPDQVKAGLFFNGETVTVTGERDPGQPLLLLVIGPQRTQQIAPLGKHNGIWVEEDAHTLPQALGFLAIAGSQPLPELMPLFNDAMTTAGLTSILDYLRLPPETNHAPTPNWYHAYASLLERQSLFLPGVALQDNPDSGTFSTTIRLPSNAPPGRYQVVALTGASDQPLVVTTHLNLIKSGITSRLEGAALHQPVVYGISALLFALLVGWVIGLLLNRR
ncbi:MAG: TIGR02186 family protein [Immundisolibacteraceae bacterium]|nr:TIGR02186 family protein [Immundisolibacteraceae bacterium]